MKMYHSVLSKKQLRYEMQQTLRCKMYEKFCKFGKFFFSLYEYSQKRFSSSFSQMYNYGNIYYYF